MNPQYQTHIQRYAPKGFLGLGKEMAPSSQGDYVKASELERETMRANQLASTLDAVRFRERQLDVRVKELGDLADKVQKENKAIRNLIELADVLSELTPKKGKAKDASLAYRKARGIEG